MNVNKDTDTITLAFSEAKLPELLSAAEVEKYFGKSERTLRRWSDPKCGLLKKVSIGRAIYYRVEDIRRLVEG